ncbi:hypothetical protein [Brevundimonas balnearis]|uniref:HIRAN domain-containing protein n=1 Tax=Brevundimonas balnearis TaxID=1572858 RepID=A0ABV6R2M7_9CAUL
MFGWLFGRRKAKAPIVAVQPVRREPTPMVQWRPDSFPMPVVGESHYQDALVAIFGRHRRYGTEEETEALVRLDPMNAYDPNAVVVTIDNRIVGFLPRDQAVRVGAALREAKLTQVRARAQGRGGWRTNQYDEGHYGVKLAIPTYGWIDLGVGASPPPKPPRKKPVRKPKAS